MSISKRPLMIGGTLIGVFASAVAIRYLVARPEVRSWLANMRLDPRLRQSASMTDRYVDLSSEDSFPPSDAPSFTPTTSRGHPNSTSCATLPGPEPRLNGLTGAT